MYKFCLYATIFLCATMGLAQLGPGEVLLSATVKDNAVMAASSEIWQAQQFTLNENVKLDSAQITMQVTGQIKVLVTDGLMARGTTVFSSQTIYGTFPESLVTINWQPALQLAAGTYYLVFMNDIGTDHLLDAGLTVSNGSYYEPLGSVGGLWWSLGNYDFQLSQYPGIMFQLVGRKIPALRRAK